MNTILEAMKNIYYCTACGKNHTQNDGRYKDHLKYDINNRFRPYHGTFQPASSGKYHFFEAGSTVSLCKKVVLLDADTVNEPEEEEIICSLCKRQLPGYIT